MKKIISIILVSMLVFTYGFFALASSDSDDDKKPKVADSDVTAKPDDSGNTENDPSKTERLEVKVGEKVTVDNVDINFVKYEDNYTNINKLSKPSDGMKVVRFYFECKNVGDSDKSISSFDFDCYADDEKCNTFYWAEDDELSGSFSAGRTCKGSLFYEIPKNTEHVELEYEYDFWDDKKIVFVGK